MDKIDNIGIYVHIPFCKSKCPYCDFYSLRMKACSDEYIDALCDEIINLRRVRDFVPTDKRFAVDTVYFGGGTPSIMSLTQINSILDAIRQRFDLHRDAEITVECNPSSENLEEFIDFSAKIGVNRLSIGMQSFVDKERKLLGRKGNADSVAQAIEISKKAGINNISLDIMLGVPESDINSLNKTLEFAVSCNVTHLSCYMLKIEEGTFYHKNASKLNLPSEDMVCDMYLYMAQYLQEQGFIHYEVSNFAKEGFEARHNNKYWNNSAYIGFGPSAHSFYGGKRFYFSASIEDFLEGKKAIFDSFGGDEEERIMLSLRTNKGISLENKNNRFLNKARQFEKAGLAEINDNKFSLTAKGFLVSNCIITELISV